MRTRVILLVSILIFPALSFRLVAQEDDAELLPSRGRFYIAPDFGLVIGYPTRIEVSPVLGYYPLERLSFAIGARYQYYYRSDRYSNIGVPGYETHIYGPRAYTRLTIIKNLGELLPVRSSVEIFAHAEFQALSLQNKYFGTIDDNSGRFWYKTMLIGGGISQPASDRIRINLTVLWDIDVNSLAIFSNPIMNFGVQIFLGRTY